MSVFKAYDIRGTYPDQIDEKAFFKIGLAAAQALKIQSAVVGRDMRASGVTLAASLIKGLAAAGVNVIDIGMASTPMLYGATVHFKSSAGFQVTASHNPAEYNGLKICLADAVPVAYDTGLETIEQIFRAEPAPPAPVSGEITTEDFLVDYVSEMLKYADGLKPLTIVADAGNGVMGEMLPTLFEKLPCELIPLYFTPDGTFPHHEANPLVAENLRDVIAKVRETGADVGVAFDGDGDRAMFVDETGAIVPCDAITVLLARGILRRQPGATIVYDLRSSRMTPEGILAAGGKPLISRVGHSFIKKLMRDTGAEFAGELSGHFYFKVLHYTDNAEMAMLSLLREMSSSGQKLSEIVAPLRTYSATGEINFTGVNPPTKLAEIEKHYAAQPGAEILRLDGLTVNFADWWFNLRPSNTEPVVRLNLEADTAALRDEKKQEVEDLLYGK
jgi:phosphomannomutase